MSAGRGAAAIVTGPVGCGKTTVLHSAIEQALERGYTVLTAMGSADESEFPYGVIEQLFRRSELPDTASRRKLLDLVCAAGAGQVNPIDVMAASVQLMSELSSQQPVLICVDDAEHCDPESLASLCYLLRRIAWMSAGIVLGHGPAGRSEIQSQLAETACRRGIAHVEIAPLRLDQVTSALVEAFDGSTAERYAGAFLQISGGNAMLVGALITDLAAARRAGEEPEEPVGAMFTRAVQACLRRTRPNGLLVGRAIAALDEASCSQLLGRLTGLDERAIDAAIRTLTAAGLLEQERFRSQAMRSAVLDDIPSADRIRLHHQAALTLRGEGASASVIAGHLLAAGPVRKDWASELLVDVANQALDVDDVALATRCLQLADACCQEPTYRHVIRTALAKAMWRQQPEAAARTLLTLVEAARAGELNGMTRLKVAHGLLMRGRIDEAMELAAPVLTAEEITDPELALEVEIDRLWLATTYPGAFKRLEPGLAKPAFAGQLPPHPVANSRRVSNQVLLTALRRGADDALVAEAERVLHNLTVTDTSLDSIRLAITTLIYADRLRAAARWCDLLLGRVANRPARTWEAYLLSTRALVSLRAGSLRKAADTAQRSLDAMSAEAWGVEIGMPLATLIEALTAIGEHTAAAEAVAIPVSEALLESRFGLHYLYARGRHHLATGYIDAALADFTSCGEKSRAWDLDTAALVPWRVGVVECLLLRQENERARKLADQHVALTTRSERRIRAVALRTQAATRPPSQRLELLTNALELLQPDGNRYEQALILSELGRAQQRQGGAGKARLLIRQARHLAEECGAQELSQSLTPKMAPPASAGSSQAGTDTPLLNLSEAERRVMAMASQGYTNREISAKLFITVSTVEQHLTRVYRKLNVRDRLQLSALAAS